MQSGRTFRNRRSFFVYISLGLGGVKSLMKLAADTKAYGYTQERWRMPARPCGVQYRHARALVCAPQ